MLLVPWKRSCAGNALELDYRLVERFGCAEQFWIVDVVSLADGRKGRGDSHGRHDQGLGHGVLRLGARLQKNRAGARDKSHSPCQSFDSTVFLIA